MNPRTRSRWLRGAGPALAVLIAALMLVAPASAAVRQPGQFASAPVAASDVTTVTRVDTRDPIMALTFDCGSDAGYTAQILDTAAAKGVKLSFGMTGSFAAANPALVKRMVAEGHQLINHSWSHPDFTTISSAQRADQLKRTADLVRQQTGISMAPYFRPPYGAYNDAVLADIAADGYTVNVMWTVDTLGWKGVSIAEISKRTLDAAAPGAVVLMHVGAESQDGPALAGLIDQLRARGYSFATVRDLVEGHASPQFRYFPETQQLVGNAFLRYWERFGGLQTFGFPLTGEFAENGVTVQYFERARFEYHPGVWPARYDVLLGLLGNNLTAQRRAAGEAPFKPIQAGSDANCTFYAATGHRLCFGFRDYWQAHGGLEILGYPISEEFRENGITVQYFERQRLEYHPENRAPWDILGGRLGAQVLAGR